MITQRPLIGSFRSSGLNSDMLSSNCFLKIDRISPRAHRAYYSKRTDRQAQARRTADGSFLCGSLSAKIGLSYVLGSHQPDSVVCGGFMNSNGLLRAVVITVVLAVLLSAPAVPTVRVAAQSGRQPEKK